MVKVAEILKGLMLQNYLKGQGCRNAKMVKFAEILKGLRLQKY